MIICHFLTFWLILRLHLTPFCQEYQWLTIQQYFCLNLNHCGTKKGNIVEWFDDYPPSIWSVGEEGTDRQENKHTKENISWLTVTNSISSKSVTLLKWCFYIWIENVLPFCWIKSVHEQKLTSVGFEPTPVKTTALT